MRSVIQRVSHAKVVVEGKVVGEIEKGLLALVGFGPNDTEKEMDYIIDKTINLRIFEDENEKMNLSLKDINGGLLIIPNFTLYGDARKGKRPSFASGAPVQVASELFEKLVKKSKELHLKVESGIFQADMKVELLNDGPVTIMLDSDKLF